MRPAIARRTSETNRLPSKPAFPITASTPTVEPLPLLGGDLERSDDDQRNACRRGIPVERIDDVEAAHLRHHQVEHDQVGQLTLGDLDRFASAVRAEHRVAKSCICSAISSTDFGSSSTTSTFRACPPTIGNSPSSTSESYNSCRDTGDCITAAAPSAKPLVAIGENRDDHHRNVSQSRDALESVSETSIRRRRAS